MRRSFAVVVAVAGWTAACGSFGEGGATTSSTDAGANAVGEAGTDASADAAPPLVSRCGDVAFSTGFDVSADMPGFHPGTTTSGTIVWAEKDGMKAPGALEARTSASGQAQLGRNFSPALGYDARLVFAMNARTLGSGVKAFAGCTLELDSMIDGGAESMSIGLVMANEGVAFVQTRSPGSDAPAVAVGPLARGKWYVVELAMSEVTPASARIQASGDGVRVALTTDVVQLVAPPSFFRVKCGIDSASGEADVLVDDVTFETCPR